jgi:hypothetical protein
VSASVTASLTAATLAGGKTTAKQLRPYKIDPTPFDAILWGSIPNVKASQMSHVLPRTLAELLLMVEARQQLQLQTKKPVSFRIAPQPFTDDGAGR